MPRYLGTTVMVPSKLDRHTTPATGDQHVLARGLDGEIRAFLNVCPHRNNQLVPVDRAVNGVSRVSRKGKLTPNGSLVCPFHRYTYDAHGDIVFAPAFEERKCTPRLSLEGVSLRACGDLLFERTGEYPLLLADVMEHEEFARLGIRPFDLQGMKLAAVDASIEKFSALTAGEVFGDTDHVDDIHRDSFDQLVDMSQLSIDVKSLDWSMQFVGWREKTTVICDEYFAYRAAVLAKGNIPRYGAVWMLYGPCTTFEWYPTDVPDEHVFVVSVFEPLPDGGCRNLIEWYAPRALKERNPELLPALRDAYAVTAAEDRELCLSSEEGRRTLVQNGLGERTLGPTHPLQEGCVDHYYAMLAQQLSALASGT
jgi:choline monooxygenase